MAAVTSRFSLVRAQDVKEQQRRKAEVARQEMVDYFAQQRSMDAASTATSKDDQKRRMRLHRERQAEFQLLDDLAKAERLHELAAVRRDEEQRIAAVLEQQQHKADCSARELQHLREQSAELRQLQEHIKTAKVAMERRLQLQEQQMLQQQQREYDVAFDKHMDEQREEAMRADAEAAAQRKAGSSQARLQLEAQMREKLDLQRKQQEEFAKERQMVDDVVARIEAEDQAEAEARRAAQRDTQAYVQGFLQQQAALKAQRQRELEEEDRRIAAYLAQRQAREDEEAARKAAKKESADRVYERLKGDQEAAQARAEEEERLINLLRAEEGAERARLEAKARQQKQEQSRLEMIKANEEQKRLKAERAERERAEEEAFRAAAMARFAEEDRVEQMHAQKRRLRVAAHAREVERLVQEKRAMYEAAMAAEAEAEARAAAEEERKAGIVRAERERLLREAAHLREYLPRHVVKDLEQLHVEPASPQAQTTRQQQAGTSTGEPQQDAAPLHYANYVPAQAYQRPAEHADLTYGYYKTH